MISQDLLVAKGSIEAVIALADNGTLDTSDLSDEMDVAEGTARERLTEMRDAGLVSEDADLRDGRPVRVFSSTARGDELADHLTTILAGSEAEDETADEDE